MRQKLHVGPRQAALARRPGQPLGMHSASPTVYPPGRVLEKHRNVPDWNEFEPPHGQRVVSRRRLLASWTDRTAIATRRYWNDQADPAAVIPPPRLAIYKGLELLDSIQNSLQLHPVSVSCFDCFAANRNTGFGSGCATLFVFPLICDPDPAPTLRKIPIT